MKETGHVHGNKRKKGYQHSANGWVLKMNKKTISEVFWTAFQNSLYDLIQHHHKVTVFASANNPSSKEWETQKGDSRS